MTQLLEYLWLNYLTFYSFMVRAKAVSIAYTHRQNTPLETAVYWAEHVAETGGTLLQSEAIHLPWYIYYSVDVWAFVITVTIVISFLFVLLVKKMCSKGFTKREKTE